MVTLALRPDVKLEAVKLEAVNPEAVNPEAVKRETVTREVRVADKGARQPAAAGDTDPGARPDGRFQVRPWSVIHASDRVRELLALVEAQRALGMRPILVTPAGFGTIEWYLRSDPQDEERPVSLLSMWQEVRQWRKSLLDSDPARAAEIVHAHSFAAGMASVRNCPAVVYDLAGFVESSAEPDQQWLARSLRVAEQFVLSRAAAVVVHANSMRAAAIGRGADEVAVFVVPHPLDLENVPAPARDQAWLDALGVPPGSVTFFAAGADAQHLNPLLQSFAQTVSEAPEVVLLVPMGGALGASLRSRLQDCGLSHTVCVVEPSAAAMALAASDVVVAGADSGPGPGGAALSALSAGRALLAADAEANRDVTPDGRGCLWYREDDVRDLAARAAFLARNPDSATPSPPLDATSCARRARPRPSPAGTTPSTVAPTPAAAPTPPRAFPSCTLSPLRRASRAAGNPVWPRPSRGGTRNTRIEDPVYRSRRRSDPTSGFPQLHPIPAAAGF